MTIKSILAASAALLIAGPFTGQAAQAAEIAALWGDNTISIVDTSQKKVVKTWPITGINGKVLGIDVRPADGMLYAVGSDGGVYTVDNRTGKATLKSRLETMLPAGVAATVDFNPAADRLRLMGSDGTSLRANVDDGKVTKDGSHKYADMHKGEKPNVVAGAYTNSFKGTKDTTLYNIDGTLGALVRQAPPNDGILNAVGKLGIKADWVAFDIWSDGNGRNEAWLMAGDTLYSVDLMSGKATPAAKIAGAKGPVRDIAILPAM